MSSGTTDQGAIGESTPSSTEDTKGNHQQTKGSPRYRRKQYNGDVKNRNSGSKTSTFKGATAEIANYVFLCHSESKKRGNLQDTIDGIKT